MEAPFERRREGYLLSTDPRRLDVARVHAWLAASYWAAGIPRDVVERSIAGSLCFGVYEEGGAGTQVAFARAITDGATYAYLADVVVEESQRGRGLGVWLMECIGAHPDLQGLRRWSLVTRDAHALYARFGFGGLASPERYMEKVDTEVYLRPRVRPPAS
ncbi:MAG TPA: GNAT family N-acetyltransferase [Vicinamibacteria bacterium]|nr:GNAT family N-acetyltransferase [Vicinamibacteria bacterium]